MNVTTKGIALLTQTSLRDAVVNNNFVNLILLFTGLMFLGLVLLLSLNKDFDYKLIKFKKGADKIEGTKFFTRVCLCLSVCYLGLGFVSIKLADSTIRQTFSEVVIDITQNDSKMIDKQNKILLDEVENELFKMKELAFEPFERVVNIFSSKGSAADK